MTNKICIILLSLNLFIQKSYSQSDKKNDTSVLYTILLIEKENFSKDIHNLIVSGSALDSFFVISDEDTIKVSYKFPFLLMNKLDLTTIKNKSIGNSASKNYLFFSYKNDKRKFWLRLPFNLLFDEYWLEIIHERKSTDNFNCSLASLSNVFNTNNMQLLVPLVRSLPLDKTALK